MTRHCCVPRALMRTYGRCTTTGEICACEARLDFQITCNNKSTSAALRSGSLHFVLQVAAKDLPQLLKELQPLIPTESAKPVHTEDFEDGRRIPSLKELLLEARAPHYEHNLAA